MSAFDGLFSDPHNGTIQELLFTCAHWHALAKLRMHTKHTLQILEELTTTLGDQLRFFANVTCSDYSTVELPREAAARKRRRSKKSQVNVPNDKEAACGTRRKKTFNMNTYKHHALGDYVETIRTYGTCDSYSTEAVCIHRPLCVLHNLHRLYFRVSWNIVPLNVATRVPIGGSSSSR